MNRAWTRLLQELDFNEQRHWSLHPYYNQAWLYLKLCYLLHSIILNFNIWILLHLKLIKLFRCFTMNLGKMCPPYTVCCRMQFLKMKKIAKSMFQSDLIFNGCKMYFFFQNSYLFVLLFKANCRVRVHWDNGFKFFFN